MKRVETARDILLLGLDTGERKIQESTADISQEEYHWEPIPRSERIADVALPPERKRVWRVFQKEGRWTYDYALARADPPAFTTVAWIMNHIAQTTDMYLYCVKTGKPEGSERRWEDLPVSCDYQGMCTYITAVLAEVREYLRSMGKEQSNNELNKLTPAPWGEMRPTYMNLWGGIIEHNLQHAMQIAARKDRIRYGH